MGSICNCYVDTLVQLNVLWAKCLARIGSFCATNPWRTILLFFVLSLCCAAGVTQIKIESRTIRIWVDQNSKPMNDRREYNAIYDEESLFALYLAIGKDDKPGNNILTKAVFDELFELHDILMDVRTTKGNFSFEELCLRSPAGDCIASGALKYWNYDSSFYNATVHNDTDVQTFCAQPKFPGMATFIPVVWVYRNIPFQNFMVYTVIDGTTPVFDEIFGEYQVVNGLATARALSSSYISALGKQHSKINSFGKHHVGVSL